MTVCRHVGHFSSRSWMRHPEHKRCPHGSRNRSTFLSMHTGHVYSLYLCACVSVSTRFIDLSFPASTLILSFISEYSVDRRRVSIIVSSVARKSESSIVVSANWIWRISFVNRSNSNSAARYSRRIREYSSLYWPSVFSKLFQSSPSSTCAGGTLGTLSPGTDSANSADVKLPDMVF